jgi:uncharacterized protein (TIGR02284 family)
MTHKEVIATLNDLIETCKDGEYGFRACADHVGSDELRLLLDRRGNECEQAAKELQSQVELLGGEPDTKGSASGALHRGWVAARGKLAGYTDLAMLKECERGEDVALARYRRALVCELPTGVKSVVERQFQGVQSNHDQIRNLRDRLKTTA